MFKKVERKQFCKMQATICGILNATGYFQYSLLKGVNKPNSNSSLRYTRHHSICSESLMKAT